MRRLTDAWFEFNGAKCTDKGVRIMEMPERPHPKAKGKSVSVPGRMGDVWMPDGAYDIITISVSCSTIGDNFSINAINAWLTGEGDLRFSDESDIIYRARVSDMFTRGNRWLNFADQEFIISFTCQPMRYRHLSTASADDVEITTSGTAVTNLGTMYSEPKITINGAGDCTVTINAQEISIEGLTNGIVIDSELQDCLNLDESQLMNSGVSMDEFPTMKTGSNLVSFTGGITSITIRPRWRFI